jgi:hypothetical protein
VSLFAEAERAASSGIALYSPVVVETGSYAKSGHATAVDWLSAVSGTSAGVAKGRLAAAERAASTPALTEALRDADLSSSQLKLLADAATSTTDGVSTLLPLVANQASHKELSDVAARLRAAARCKETERARRARVHAGRHFRWHQDESGGIRGEFLCDEVAWARVAPRLEADAKERWRLAGSTRESLDAHRLDAFLDLLSSTGSGQSDAGAEPHFLVLIDAAAIQRGSTKGSELCEIDGIGPVSVEAVTELLGEGGMQYLVRDGVDVRTMTSSTRARVQRIEMALMVRDRICAVPGCGKRLGLEVDHRETDFGKGGPTELANLVRLCGPHHNMKTNGGWRLTGGPGHWSWVPPPRPPSANYIARARKLKAAKAIAKSRNDPRRT